MKHYFHNSVSLSIFYFLNRYDSAYTQTIPILIHLKIKLRQHIQGHDSYTPQ